MTRSELEQLIADKQPELSKETVVRCVDLILQEVSNALVEGRRVEIRGFGSFGLRRRVSRVGRNPRTGESVYVPERHVPYFRPGRALRDRIDQARERDDNTHKRLEEIWKNRDSETLESDS